MLSHVYHGAAIRPILPYQTVMAGLVPAIHVFSFDKKENEKERRGCPAQGRA
jgi:hypothetical protein